MSFDARRYDTNGNLVDYGGCLTGDANEDLRLNGRDN